MRIQRNILLNPGPATTTDTVKRALVVPDVCPREKAFSGVMAEVRRDLVRVVRGGREYACVLFAGSGTCAVEACVSSVVPPGRAIAVVNNGAYGERMLQMAAAHGIRAVEIPFDWAALPDPAAVERALRRDRAIACLAMVHHETSSGLLNPLRPMASLARRRGCAFLVDAMSSFAGVPIDVRRDGVDFLVSSSNKCIQGMAGLSFVIARRSRLDALKPYPRRSLYLDLHSQYAYLEAHGQMPFTAPVQVVYALRQAIREYFAEGGLNRARRYTANWRTLRAGLQAMGFRFLLPAEQESHILTTILEPDHPRFDFDRMHDRLFDLGFTVYPGKLGNRKCFRLANMGDLRPRDIRAFLKALAGVLKRMGVTMEA
jgi:2-aminoethylphosphonate aminotransferase